MAALLSNEQKRLANKQLSSKNNLQNELICHCRDLNTKMLKLGRCGRNGAGGEVPKETQAVLFV